MCNDELCAEKNCNQQDLVKRIINKQKKVQDIVQMSVCTMSHQVQRGVCTMS